MPQYTRYIGFEGSADTIVIAEARPGLSQKGQPLIRATGS